MLIPGMHSAVQGEVTGDAVTSEPTKPTTTTAAWGALCEDVIQMVYTTCFSDSPDSRRAMRLVCKHWSEAARHGINSLTLRPLSNLRVSQLLDVVLDSFPAVTSLDLSRLWYSLQDSQLACLSSLHHLTNLNLDSCIRIGDEGLSHLSCHTSLSSLGLKLCVGVSEVGLQVFDSFPNLASVRLTGCGLVDDGALRWLSRYTSLRSLGILACQRVTEVPAFRGVTFLEFGNSELGARGLRDLPRFPCLRHLKVQHLRYCSIDAVIEVVARVTSLTRLSLSYIDVRGGLRHLTSLEGLSHLDLSWAGVGGSEWQALTAFPAVRRLTLEGCDLVDDDFRNVGRFATNLEYLRLSGLQTSRGRVTREGLQSLRAAMKSPMFVLDAALYRDYVTRSTESTSAGQDQDQPLIEGLVGNEVEDGPAGA
ncbi:unnamed protein product [Ostreobium quekettii]|uniref:Uncharacterized protein n=1 Tax=Ostreobium quekettii TaxID=121088 RepID=A0A8S1ITC1_9CHLO|nr:unnamed protein product [Ostreobium quekettii]|eukprot:evm.model.scf_866.2 EVM.evm.TU.scf_866.2   scf_866:14875-17140(+)